ncbi:MAG: hypothetical protein ACYC6G_13720 [Desulfobaccales bacterium]
MSLQHTEIKHGDFVDPMITFWHGKVITYSLSHFEAIANSFKRVIRCSHSCWEEKDKLSLLHAFLASLIGTCCHRKAVELGFSKSRHRRKMKNTGLLRLASPEGSN